MEAGRSVDGTVNELARKFRRPRVEVGVGTVGALVDKVARVNVTVLVKVDSDAAAVVSATWTATLLLETSAGTEAGISVEAKIGKVSARGAGTPRVGAGAPTVLTTTGASVDSFVVGRERVVASATMLGTAVSRLGVVGASVRTAGPAGTEAVLIG